MKTGANNNNPLDDLLGLGESEDKEALIELKGRVKDSDSSANQALLDEVWQNLKQKKAELDTSSATKGKVIQGPKKWFNGTKIGIISGVAAAALAVVIITNQNITKPEMVLLSSKDKGKVINISKPFSTNNEKLLLAKSEKVNLWFRGANDFQLKMSSESNDFSFQRGIVLFHYEHLVGNKPVSIQTPHGKFSIVGTEFFLRVKENETHLLVFEGIVAVAYQDKNIEVKQNQLFNTADGSITNMGKKPVKATLTAFKDASLANEAFIDAYENSSKNNKPRRWRIVSVEMKNGQIFKGKLIKQTTNSIKLIYLEGQEPLVLAKKDIKSFKIRTKK